MQLFFSAEDRKDLVGDVAVLLRAGEFAGAGAVGEQGDHHRGVTLGGEDAEGVAVLGFGLGEDRGAGLVVGADDHEGVAVALGEADGGLDGLVEVEGFLDGAREVVGVLALVDAGAFDHQEEAVLLVLLLHEEVDGSACDVLQGEVVLRAVDGVGDGAALYLTRLLGLEENHLLSLLCLLLVLLVATYDGEAVSFCLLVEVGTAVGVLGLVEVRCSEEVDVRLGELFANLVVLVAVTDVCIEGSGCGVVYADTRRDADGCTGLAGPVSNAGDGGRQVLQYAQGAVLCLVAAGKGSAACGRVGHAVCGALCVDESHIGEAGEAEFLDADAAFQGTEVSLGSIDLVDAHAVANEVEHILGLAFSKGSESNRQNAQERKESFLHVIKYIWLFNFAHLSKMLCKVTN